MSPGRRTAAVVPTGHSGCYSSVRSLGRRGVYTILVSADERPPESLSRFCDETVHVPSCDADLLAYRDALLDVAERPDVRTVIPTREEDVYVLSRFHDAFAEHVDLAIPTPRQLRTVHDRLALAAAAEEAGVPVPETELLTDVNDWGRELIVKSRYNLLTDAYVDGVGHGETATVKDVIHLSPGASPDVDALRERFRHTPIAQSYVRSDAEFMIGAIYDHGEPLATFQHRQIRGNSYVGGGGVFRRSVYVPRLETAARQLLNSLDWHGLACIEYMRDAETGEFVLTEINPRTWQSLSTAVRAGADFPWYYWLLISGRGDEIEPNYEIGSASHLLKGELGYLRSIQRDDSPHVAKPSLVREAAAVTGSCLTEPRFDHLRLDDPAPFIRTVGNALRRR